MKPEPATVPDPAAPRAFVLVGPTASGKTEVAHRLARHLGARVLSADSMLVYRGMDIGTAKPPAADRAAFGYAGVDLVAPDGGFSVAAYLDRATDAVRGAPGAAWIVAGGTGLYVRCLLQGLDPAPGPDAAARAEAGALLDSGGVAALAARLREAAPGARVRDERNPRRLVRAYERAVRGDAAPGVAWAAPGPRIVGLQPDRALLARRIGARARAMFEGGLLDEARALRAAFPALSATARQAIGYREAFAVLDGAMSVAEAVERTAIRTRQLAKRQMTWFRHQADVDWVPVGGGMTVESVAAEVLRRWETHGPARLAV